MLIVLLIIFKLILIFASRLFNIFLYAFLHLKLILFQDAVCLIFLSKEKSRFTIIQIITVDPDYSLAVNIELKLQERSELYQNQNQNEFQLIIITFLTGLRSGSGTGYLVYPRTSRHYRMEENFCDDLNMIIFKTRKPC